MQDTGQLSDIPYMPPLEGKAYSSPINTNPSSSDRHAIAKDAAKFVIQSELKKLLMKWKKDFEEHDLETLQKVYLAAPKFEEDEKEFDFADFDAELDCDSASDISDRD